LIDCTSDFNYGCEGGFLDETFPYISQYGLETEDSYPYTGDPSAILSNHAVNLIYL